VSTLLEHSAPLGAHDFHPGLIRLQRTPPNPLGRWMLWTVLAFLFALLAWATFARLDIVAVAEGKLVPDSYVKIVQPVDAGVVKEILVREGEHVKAGQVLLRMDPALSDSDLKTLAADVQNRRMAVHRIDAQLAGASFTRRKDESPDLFAQVHAQFEANRQAYENSLAQERALLDKANFDLHAAEQIKRKLMQTLPHYREQEAAYEKLTRDGFAGRLMYTDKQRERIEKEQDLQAQEAAIAAAQAARAQQERKIAQITADYRRQLLTERVDVTAQLDKAGQDLAKQQHRNAYLELRAPQDGVVKDLATHTVGTVASPGTILMTLVPNNERLLAEVWLRNDDIGFVHVAQPVRLKLSTYLFQKYGMVQGEIEQVAADSAEISAGTAAPASRANAGALAYKALVSLKSQHLESDGVAHRLAPGMQVSAEIHLGTRTVLEYLLSPVQKAWHEAGRER
jgi:hemolysin D